MSALHECPSCARHVRVDEPVCPFCTGSLERARPGRVHLVSRSELTRLAVVVGAALLAAACDGAAEPEEPEEERRTSGYERPHRHTGERQIHCGEGDPDLCPAPPYGAPAIDWV